MFKNIDDHYIKLLKEGLNELVIAKKLSSKDKVTEFFKGTLSLKEACNIFVDINKYSYRKRLFPTSNKKMIEYFYNAGMLDDEDIGNIEEFLWDYSFNEEEYENEEIDVEGVSDFIKAFISKKLIGTGIALYKESFYDIATGNVAEPNEIFTNLRLALHSHLGYAPSEDSDEDEEEEDLESLVAESFYETFQDDAKVYIFENYEFSQKLIERIDKSFLSADNSLLSEIYNEDGHAMLAISDNQIYDGLNVEVLLLILIEISNMRCK